MKPIKIIFTITIFAFILGCNTTKTQNDNLIEITGFLKPIEMSTWQYGTHTISNDENFYALKSDKIDLEAYEGKTVTIKAEKIAGYPVDGGPDYLLVQEIKE